MTWRIIGVVRIRVLKCLKVRVLESRRDCPTCFLEQNTTTWRWRTTKTTDRIPYGHAREDGYAGDAARLTATIVVAGLWWRARGTPKKFDIYRVDRDTNRGDGVRGYCHCRFKRSLTRLSRLCGFGEHFYTRTFDVRRISISVYETFCECSCVFFLSIRDIGNIQKISSKYHQTLSPFYLLAVELRCERFDDGSAVSQGYRKRTVFTRTALPVFECN